MRYRQTFAVEGTGDFPYDMLRYDQCWPCLETETPLMDSNKMLHDDDWFRKPRRVSMARDVEQKGDVPSVGRWRSFNWHVVEESIETFKR